MPMKIKVCFSNETHRICRVPECLLLFRELLNTIFISQLPGEWTLEYLDSDGDKVMLADDADYSEFIESHKDESVKVFIVPRTETVVDIKKEEENEQNGVEAEIEKAQQDERLEKGIEDEEILLRKETEEKDVGSEAEYQIIGGDEKVEIRSVDSRGSEMDLRSEAEIIQKEEERLEEKRNEEQRDIPNEEVMTKEDLISYETERKIEQDVKEEPQVQKIGSTEEEFMKALEDIKAAILEENKKMDQEPSGDPNEKYDHPTNNKKSLEVNKPENISPKIVKKPVPPVPKIVKNAKAKPVFKPAKLFIKGPALDELITKAVEKNIEKIAGMTQAFLEKKSQKIGEKVKKEPELKESQAEKQEQSKKPLHRGIFCDGCRVSPLEGTRYKCSVCEDFDFCETCEAERYHPHAFIKIKCPGHQFAHSSNGPRMNFPPPPHHSPFHSHPPMNHPPMHGNPPRFGHFPHMRPFPHHYPPCHPFGPFHMNNGPHPFTQFSGSAGPNCEWQREENRQEEHSTNIGTSMDNSTMSVKESEKNESECERMKGKEMEMRNVVKSIGLLEEIRNFDTIHKEKKIKNLVKSIGLLEEIRSFERKKEEKKREEKKKDEQEHDDIGELLNQIRNFRRKEKYEKEEVSEKDRISEEHDVVEYLLGQGEKLHMNEEFEKEEYSEAVRRRAEEVKERIPDLDMEMLLEFIKHAPEDLDTAELVANFRI